MVSCAQQEIFIFRAYGRNRHFIGNRNTSTATNRTNAAAGISANESIDRAEALIR